MSRDFWFYQLMLRVGNWEHARGVMFNERHVENKRRALINFIRMHRP